MATVMSLTVLTIRPVGLVAIRMHVKSAMTAIISMEMVAPAIARLKRNGSVWTTLVMICGVSAVAVLSAATASLKLIPPRLVSEILSNNVT